MPEKVIGKCPVCGQNMRVTELECPGCHTKVRGQLDLGKFSRLNQNQLEFVEVFIRLRGNIKEVEEEMGISYPTVRKKLDEVIEALGYRPEKSPDNEAVKKRNEVLDALDDGEIDFEEAKNRLEEL
ncbi:DUF2089 domain-containing protein [Candidatus Bipolaricaulota bacterium]|nr:DUF2089 domain-containing protein [Candidatus Bipolaricaulota bacterium]